MELSKKERPADSFGRRLRAARLAAGLTLAALSARSGVHLVTISRIECGRAGSSLELAARLAKALGMRLDDLLPTALRAALRSER